MAQMTKYKTKCKLKKGDEVVVLTGDSKGETGKIDKLDFKKHRVYVSQVNLAKKHAKPSGDQEGGIIEVAMPIAISNVALVDPKSKKPSRVGYRIEENKKVRIAKKSQTVIG